MNTSSPTPRRSRIVSSIAGWLPTSRRRRLLAVQEAFEVGYRAGKYDASLI